MMIDIFTFMKDAQITFLFETVVCTWFWPHERECSTYFLQTNHRFSKSLSQLFLNCFQVLLCKKEAGTVSLKWDKVFNNEPSKICGRQPLQNLKRYVWSQL